MQRTMFNVDLIMQPQHAAAPAAPFNHALQRPYEAIALWLQFTRPAGRVAELASLTASTTP